MRCYCATQPGYFLFDLFLSNLFVGFWVLSENLTTRVTPVGFEPTQLTLVELESTPLDHSGKVSMLIVLGVISNVLFS